MADQPHLFEASTELKARVARAIHALGAALDAVGASETEAVNALALLLVSSALRNRVSFGQLLVVLRADWSLMHGPPASTADAAIAAREAGMEDLAIVLEADLPNAPQRPARELRGDLRHMRRRRGN